MADNLTARLTDILLATPNLMRVMTTVRGFDLPDWLLFSGCIYQPVLNHLTGRSLDHGLKDYDLGYFDPDTSYEAEDAYIRRVAAGLDPDLRDLVEVRNQARVHLWFEDHFGEPYAPLTHTAECLTQFLSPSFAVGVRLESDDSLTVIAPFGLEDLFAMRLRANPGRISTNFGKVTQAAKARWPELTVEP